jgi:CxxC motif-containing protein
MMKTSCDVTCLICPIGCRAKVIFKGPHAPSILNLECSRGEPYVLSEIQTPLRDFFTTIRIEGAKISVLPVRTTGPIPKDKLLDCTRELSGIVIKAPVKLGSVIVKNILNLRVDVIATRTVDVWKP